jgi:acetyl esterase/lipase
VVGNIFLIGALMGAWRTWNAKRPPHAGRVGPLWLPALVTGELALHQIAWQAVATALFVWGGALDSWPGWAALTITMASWVGLVWLFIQGGQAEKVIAAALEETVGVSPEVARPSLVALARAKPRLPDNVTMRAGLAYGDHERHRLDLYLPPKPNGRILLQIHGGSWSRGRRERHARPLMYSMAAGGWLVASMSYRVSPEATFPDHLIDVKRAIAWLRSSGPGFGATGDFLAVTGGSAGAHLAAMAALTGNQPEYQTEFAGADTSVQACAPFYGIYQLTRRDGTRGKWPFIERYVMKSSPLEDPEAWHAASPINLGHPEAPPFFVLHGGHDSAVRAGESRRFVAALRQAGTPVVYAEIPGATHGFDYFVSRRSTASAAGVAHFLEHAYQYREAR